LLPHTAENAEFFLNTPALQWHDIEKPLLHHRIASFKPLLTRIDPKQVDDMINEASRVATA
jgi:methionyl-tRNA synthetase